jgi:hypothetical protein
MSANGQPTVDTAKLYEAFPHLVSISEEWGTANCRRHLFALMNDTRGGTRKGFPPDHAMTIFKLLMEHDQSFPKFSDDDGSPIWHDAAHERDYWTK